MSRTSRWDDDDDGRNAKPEKFSETIQMLISFWDWSHDVCIFKKVYERESFSGQQRNLLTELAALEIFNLIVVVPVEPLQGKEALVGPK